MKLFCVEFHQHKVSNSLSLGYFVLENNLSYLEIFFVIFRMARILYPRFGKCTKE